MAGNKAVAYIEPGKVEVQSIDYPKLELQDGPGVHPDNVGRKTPHGAIIKIVATNICGSDQISLDEAPQGYADFDKGVSKKFVLDPHDMLGDKQRIAA